MLKMNVKGMVLTGVGAYLIFSKGINALSGMVSDIADAIKWKAYYKCTRPSPLAPDYVTTFNSEGEEIDGGNPPEEEENKPSSDGFGRALGEAFVKSISKAFESFEGGKKAPGSPEKATSEGDIHEEARNDGDTDGDEVIPDGSNVIDISKIAQETLLATDVESEENEKDEDQ